MSSVASANIHWHQNLTREERWATMNVIGCTLWFTGLSGSGKSTVASAFERHLIQKKQHSYLLDGDNIRFGINRDLGFSPNDRSENIRRVAEIAKLFADSGSVSLVSLISPYTEDRTKAREIHKAGGLQFFEIFVDTPLEECEKRDPKGLYAKARAGEIPNFTGISAPYERPEKPELTIDTSKVNVEQAVEMIVQHLRESGVPLP